MKKTKKAQSIPLQTINQKPGNQDCSFIGREQTQTASLPLPAPLQQQNRIKQKQRSQRQKKEKKNKHKKEKRKMKDSKGSEVPKILISHSHLKDIQLLNEQYQQTLKDAIKYMQQLGYSQEKIKRISSKIDKAIKNSLNKILDNLQVKQMRNSKQIIPIEVSLSPNFYKANQISLDLFSKAVERVKHEKPQPKPIKFNPQIPKQVLIRTQNDKHVKSGQYMELALNQNLKEEQQKIRQYQTYMINLQKRFQQFQQIYKKNHDQLNLQINKKYEGTPSYLK